MKEAKGLQSYECIAGKFVARPLIYKLDNINSRSLPASPEHGGARGS